MRLEMKIEKGQTVRLAGSVTRAEFGLALCDDDGETLEIDGVVSEVLAQGAMHELEDSYANSIGTIERSCAELGKKNSLK